MHAPKLATQPLERAKILRPERDPSVTRSGRNLALMAARRAVAVAFGGTLRGTKRSALAAALGVSERLVRKWCEETESDAKPVPLAALVMLPAEEYAALCTVLDELHDRGERGEFAP